MNISKHNIIGAIGFVLLAIMIWYFSSLFIYVLIASVITLILKPLILWLDHRKIGKFKLPRTLNVIIALLFMGMFLGTIFGVLIPLVVQQASAVQEINPVQIKEYMQQPLENVHEAMERVGLITKGEKLTDILFNEIKQLIQFEDFSNFFGGVLSTTGSIFMGLFSVTFILFFFLKEDGLSTHWILALVPEKKADNIKQVFASMKSLLSRYFIGLLLEIGSMMTIEVSLLAILGIENALLIGVLGGILNAIPYLGPAIGATIGVIIAVIGVLSAGIFSGVGLVIIKILGVFLCANLIDNIVLQPMIYGRSVKAHPIEIFLVIIMGGTLAGIPGMIAAIPFYTVLRIVAKEFLGDYRIVRELTKNL